MDHDSERPHPPFPFIDCCASCSANQTPVYQNVPPSLGTKPFFNQNTAFSPLSRVLKCFLSSQNGYFPTLSSSMKKTNYFLFIFSCVRWWHCRVPRNTYPLEQDVSCERYNVSYRNFTLSILEAERIWWRAHIRWQSLGCVIRKGIVELPMWTGMYFRTFWFSR